MRTIVSGGTSLAQSTRHHCNSGAVHKSQAGSSSGSVSANPMVRLRRAAPLSAAGGVLHVNARARPGPDRWQDPPAVRPLSDMGARPALLIPSAVGIGWQCTIRQHAEAGQDVGAGLLTSDAQLASFYRGLHEPLAAAGVVGRRRHSLERRA